MQLFNVCVDTGEKPNEGVNKSPKMGNLKKNNDHIKKPQSLLDHY